MSRAYAVAVSVAFCVAVLWPLPEAFGARRWDSFPLSWYPMFSDPRSGRERVLWVAAEDSTGRSGRGPARVSSGHWTRGGFNEGSQQLVRAQRGGPEALAAMCAQIARGVARDRRLAHADRVVVNEGRYDPARYFGLGDPTPLEERALVECPVPR